jgi:hypothetical protein
MSETPKDIDQMSDKEFEDYSNGVAKGEVDPIPEDDDKEKVEVKKDEPKEEIEEESEKEPEGKSEEKSKLDSDEDEDDDDDDEDDEDNKDDAGKPAPSMPLSKFNKQKAKWEDKLKSTVAEIETKHKAEIEDLKKSLVKPEATNESVEADIDKFAKDNNISDPNVIKGLVEVFKKTIPGIDPETKKLLAEFQESRQKNAEEAAFENDFLKTAAPAIKKLNPNIDDAHLKEAKEKLRALAYDEKYVKLDLEEIINLKQKQFVYNLDKKKTVESSRPGSKVADKVQDYENWTDDDIDSATDEEFEKYSKYMADKSPSRFIVRDKNGNEVK